MPTPVREAAMMAVFDRLSAALPAIYSGVVVERARRTPIELRTLAGPLAVLTAGSVESDTTQSPGETFYTIEFEVAVTLPSYEDAEMEADQATFHAAVVAALMPWEPATAGLGEVTEQGADFAIIPAAESARRVVEILCRFSILAITPTGSPYL